MHGFTCAAAINANRQQAGREKNQRYDGKFPIHEEENTDCADNGDRLLENIATDAGQSHLHDAGIVRDAGHQKAGTRLVKKIHRMPNHFAKKLSANIGDDLVAHPLHAIGISVGTKAADSHDRWNGEADQNDRIDFGASVQNFQI